MALSTYFNWDTLQFPNSEQSTFYEAMAAPQVATSNLQHYFPHSDESLFLSNVLFENYLDSTSGYLCPSETCPSYNNDPLIPLTHQYHEICSTHENDYNILPYPKRQKCCYEEQLQQQQHVQYSSPQEFTTPTLPSNFLDEFVVPYDNCCSLKTEELQQQFFLEVPQHGTTCVEVESEKKSNERTISPQSVAARERRRRITEKTQELGKLVPGGPKMNTAEMFHAASNYVKFLQAQVEMLQLINTLQVVQEDKTAPPSENLHALVNSPFVQEKLYPKEMCVVPKEFVITLTNHEDVQSRPTLLEDLKQLIGTVIEKKPKQE